MDGGKQASWDVTLCGDGCLVRPQERKRRIQPCRSHRGRSDSTPFGLRTSLHQPPDSAMRGRPTRIPSDIYRFTI
jgi:hypothetical protein